MFSYLKDNKIIFAFCFIGALLLAFLATFQKIIIDAPLVLKGYIVPLSFGGISGLLIGYFYNRLLIRNAKLNALNENLDKIVQEKTQELSNKIKELNNVNKLNEKLFTILAHDTKNSIGGTHNFLELIVSDLEEGENIDEIKEDLNAVKNSLWNQYQHLIMVVDWAKIHSKMKDFVVEKLSIHELANEIKSYCEDKLKAKSAHMEIYVTGKDCFICDYNLIFTVLNNVVCNSIKFIDYEGSVNIFIEADNQLHITIEDDGEGIPPDKIENIFKFDVEDVKVSNKDQKGSGLGLFIVKELLDLYGGSIDVDSKYGSYTKFFITIPMC